MVLMEITPEVVNAYFTPVDYILYLFAIFVIMVVVYQWKWTQTSRKNVLVLVVHSDGSSHNELCPKEGNSVSLKNPTKGTTKMWPINQMAFIDVLYPGVGFVPGFLQKQIRMTIVDEGDWEPIINRDPDKKLIASPEVLGNLMHEKITEAVITVNKEMLDTISSITKRLNKLVNPTIVYIGLGLLVVLMAIALFFILPAMEQVVEVADGVESIKSALGIVSSPK